MEMEDQTTGSVVLNLKHVTCTIAYNLECYIYICAHLNDNLVVQL